MNSPNNGHFGVKPTFRYSGCVLYWGIIVGAGYGMEVPCQYIYIDYMDRVNISQGYESTSNL